tara:strand:- start:3300 stop:4097 length:798 start_codon:yes stop_codon:yes gene_type:complete
MLDKSLNYLIPNKVDDLIRLGNKRDAGYIVTESSLNNCNFLISFGMAENFTIERDFLNSNLEKKVHIYDHTINKSYFFKRIYKSIKRLLYFKSNIKNILNKIQDYKDYKNIIKDTRVKHFKEKIGPENFENITSFKKVINRLQNQDKIFLKSDIEGDEFKFLKNLIDYTDKIHLMVIEFHYLDKHRNLFKEIILDLKKNFYLIHLHGNNYTDYCIDGLPKVLEITFINKKYYNIKNGEYNLSFPIKNLDFPNVENEKDLEFSFKI